MFMTGILTPSIGMNNEPRSWLALTDSVCRAVHTSSAGIVGAIAQPTILREYKSKTAAKYNQPLRVRI